ncbi:MAG: hypothetical protein JST23_04110 [Bacteroidetes bacterium]|nr:hypothetical protein [Bacteroidota bacterium]
MYSFCYAGRWRCVLCNFNKTAGVDFSVNNLNFDSNGNILTMDQKGLKINASSYIDRLTYTYQNNTNKLAQVTDAANDKNSRLDERIYDNLFILKRKGKAYQFKVQKFGAPPKMN